MRVGPKDSSYWPKATAVYAGNDDNAMPYFVKIMVISPATVYTIFLFIYFIFCMSEIEEPTGSHSK